MKILSSYKDYYDYLVGIYGEDPILVLDRREHSQPYDIIVNSTGYTTERNIKTHYLWVGDYCIQFMSYNGVPYYGEDVKNIPGITVKEGKQLHRWWVNSYESKYGLSWDELLKNGLMELSWEKGRFDGVSFLPNPVKRKRPEHLDPSVVIALGNFYNTKHNYGDSIYPILANLNLNKFVPPETVYKWITEYLSKLKLEQEQHTDTRTDVQRLEGKGFDKKTSFRPNIKK